MFRFICTTMYSAKKDIENFPINKKIGKIVEHLITIKHFLVFFFCEDICCINEFDSIPVLCHTIPCYRLSPYIKSIKTEGCMSCCVYAVFFFTYSVFPCVYIIFVHRKSFRCEMGGFSIYGKKHFRIIKKHFFAIAVLASLEVFFFLLLLLFLLPCVLCI